MMHYTYSRLERRAPVNLSTREKPNGFKPRRTYRGLPFSQVCLVLSSDDRFAKKNGRQEYLAMRQIAQV